MADRILLPLAIAFLANVLLSASSIVWHLFSGLSPIVLIIYRVVLSIVILAPLVVYLSRRGGGGLRHLTFRLVMLHVVAATLVAINWGTFIWASQYGTALESGLGYLLAPVIVMIVDQVFVRGRRSTPKRVCIGIILVSLVYLVTASDPGQLEHWVYWTIGATWGAYTLLKRQTPLSPVEGLFVEKSSLMAMFLIALTIVDAGPHAPAAAHAIAYPWLWTLGFVSVTPLVMFAFAARKLSAFNMGALQFVLPTTQLVISYVYYGQVATSATYVCFVIVWVTLIFATVAESKTVVKWRSAH